MGLVHRTTMNLQRVPYEEAARPGPGGALVTIVITER